MTSRPFSHLWSSRRTRFNHMINRFEANSSTNHGILIFDHILMINYNFQDLVCCDNLTRENICHSECEADLSESKMNLKLINPWSWERPLGFSPDRFCSHCEKTLFDWAPPCCSLLLTVRTAWYLQGEEEDGGGDLTMGYLVVQPSWLAFPAHHHHQSPLQSGDTDMPEELYNKLILPWVHLVQSKAPKYQQSK